MIDILKERWNKLVGTTNIEGIFNQIVDAYSDKRRSYHNLKHILSCLNEFDQVKEKIINKKEVELAILFHDIIYDPKESDNEEKSAKFAVSVLKGTKPTCVNIDLVEELILATKHDGPINISDAEYIADIDISIFGYQADIYMGYEKNIRKEYAWVPIDIYKEKRKEILLSFLSRDKIYYTEFFSNRYELKAHCNLEASVSLL